MKKIYQGYEKKETEKLLNELLTSMERLKADEIKKDDIIKILDAHMERLTEKADEIKRVEKSESGGDYIFEDISPEVLYEDGVILLRRPVEADREEYLSVKQQYGYSKNMYKDEEFLNILWEDYLDECALYYSIIDRANNHLIGYCGIKNLKKKIWELAIELSSDYCHKGYGSKAIMEYMKRLSELSGRKEYCVRIDADNVASQNMFEKIGFYPYGLAEYFFHSEEEKREVEEENMELIDEQIIKVAEKFGVEPRKLLSHVLEYRISL